MKLLVTGFGPFGAIADNPSSELAKNCGFDYRILEVSYEAVDAFIETELGNYDALLAIGVRASSERMAIETVAINEICPTPDVRGVVGGPSPIDPRLPKYIAATIWTGDLLSDADNWTLSTSAGSYLCNYLFFRAASAYPDKRTGFLHVPTSASVSIDEQARILDLILQALCPNMSEKRPTAL